jgi:hypothetical protein
MYVTLDKPTRVDLEKVNLDTVMPLLNFLHSLPQEPGRHRDLTWSEDSEACFILRKLPFKPIGVHYKPYVDYLVEDQYRKSRTLEVWYRIARSVAYMIETDHDCECCER